MGEMKLFVVGELSPNPDDWGWSGRAVVIARDAGEAVGLAESMGGYATEIPLDEPKLLLRVG